MSSQQDAHLDLIAASVEELARLMQSTEGDWQYDAANRLIAEHKLWLDVPAFRDFLAAHSSSEGVAVSVDWPQLVAALRENRITASKQDMDILRIAAALTPYGDEIALWDVLENQSPDAFRAIINAELHVAGYVDGLDA